MTITVFGEILWDIFDNEKKIGGAPFNFAAHAAKLGAEAELVSAVGTDALGKEVLQTLHSLHLSDRSVARLAVPTGCCRVTLHDGVPSYDLVRDVAYDSIPLPNKEAFRADAFYFGTLAQRSPVSRQTLASLLEGHYREVFFDINIRQNYYSDDLIDYSLRRSTILKISREEIGVLGVQGTEEDVCKQTAEKYPHLRLILVTLDKDGSLCYDCRTKKICYSPKPRAKVVSTVGAGDSFSAGFLYNYLAGERIEDCLTYATALSAFVVTQLGAVPDYPDGLRVRRA